MSLITLPAFLTRRREDTPMPETSTAESKNDVVMRFLTQGSAVVELHRQDRHVRHMPGASGVLMPNGESHLSHGFNWRCLGCDAIGGGGRYGMGDQHFDEREPMDSRDEANSHAEHCRSMPKPTAV